MLSESIEHPTLGPIVLENELGTGSYARVFRAKVLESNLPVAVKIFDPDICQDPEESAAIRQEFDLMQKISHPLIADVYSIFEYQGSICYIMELIDGQTLLDYVNLGGPVPEPLAKKYAVQLLLILEYLHSHSISHRDLKCENIIIDRFDNVHLIDFGFARQARPGTGLFQTTCGSPAYIAPEIIAEAPYDVRVDIWSFGVVLYAIIIGKLPFAHENVTEMMRQISCDEPVFPDTISPILRDLLVRLLDKDPAKRITIDEIKEHVWMTSGEYGITYAVDSSIFERLRESTRRHSDMDYHIGEMLGFTQEKIHSIQSSPDLSTREGLLYRMARKIGIANSLGTLGDLVLKPVPISPKRTCTFQGPRHATLSFLPLLGTHGRYNPVHARRMTSHDKITLTVRTTTQLTTQQRRLTIAKVHNNAYLTRLTRSTLA